MLFVYEFHREPRERTSWHMHKHTENASDGRMIGKQVNALHQELAAFLQIHRHEDRQAK